MLSESFGSNILCLMFLIWQMTCLDFCSRPSHCIANPQQRSSLFQTHLSQVYHTVAVMGCVIQCVFLCVYVELSELPSEINSNQLTLSKAAFLQGKYELVYNLCHLMIVLLQIACSISSYVVLFMRFTNIFWKGNFHEVAKIASENSCRATKTCKTHNFIVENIYNIMVLRTPCIFLRIQENLLLQKTQNKLLQYIEIKSNKSMLIFYY